MCIHQDLMTLGIKLMYSWHGRSCKSQGLIVIDRLLFLGVCMPIRGDCVPQKVSGSVSCRIVIISYCPCGLLSTNLKKRENIPNISTIYDESLFDLHVIGGQIRVH